MKPSDVSVGPRSPNQIESHARPTLRDQLITAGKLVTISGALFLALWFVDQMVSS
jgi:hypothetical protein